LLCIQQSQIVQRQCGVVMIATERLFPNCQRAPVQRFSVGVAALTSV
jgi:hypothetical protein